MGAVPPQRSDALVITTLLEPEEERDPALPGWPLMSRSGVPPATSWLSKRFRLKGLVGVWEDVRGPRDPDAHLIG
jgi:hypothetical protein